MVKKIEAYEAEDGKVFQTYVEAAEHDAERALVKLEVFNVASAAAIVKHAETILPFLEAVVAARNPSEAD